MKYVIKKHIDEENDIEYIDALDIFEYGKEYDDKIQDAYAFLRIVEDWFNYFNNNRSTAFGNPDLERTIGMFRGYCLAKKWETNETTNNDGSKTMRIQTYTGRCVYEIDIPKTPQGELDRRKDIRKDREALGL